MVAATPSIRIVSDCVVVDLMHQHGRVAGLLAFQADDGWVQVHANHVVLATGGIGSLWRETTNPVEATGDGLALAARAGARLADLEFVQFHPTALLPAGPGDGSRLPLLTEALRGAGALLLDADGHRFMPDEHPLAELAPRDVVARAIARRAAAGEPVLLDLRPALAAKGEATFPQGLSLCRRAGYEPLRRTRCRSRRRRITTWAASSPTIAAAPASTACGPAARWHAPACTAPTGWPATRCWRDWCSAGGSPTISARPARQPSRRPSRAAPPPADRALPALEALTSCARHCGG